MLAVSLAECRKTAIIKENKIYLMEIIYMPGFGGNENSETFKTIFSKYPNSIFINYYNRNAENAHNQILKELNKINSEDKIIVGQSLGGFWAEYFAEKYNFRVVLINPSLEPSESLAKYNLTKNELESYRKFETNKKIERGISIIISKNDTIVNPKNVIAKYKDAVEIKYVEGNHKLTEFKTLIAELEKYERIKPNG